MARESGARRPVAVTGEIELWSIRKPVTRFNAHQVISHHARIKHKVV